MSTEVPCGIIKKHAVREAGSIRLGAGAVATSGPGQAPRVRVLREMPGGLLVEVVCTCGKKMLLQCEYGDAPAPSTEGQTPSGPST